MADTEFTTVLSVEDAEKRICDYIINGSITGELLSRYELAADNNRKCVILVFEKHYWRAGNRLMLTVAIDNLSGRTRVHSTGGGGGQGLFRFDWGASESFSQAPLTALKAFISG
jgi:hypothetical protein